MRLRNLLAEQRQAGLDFETAWDASTTFLLMAMSKRQRESWSTVFSSTKTTWAQAYDYITVEPVTLHEALDALQGEPGDRSGARLVA